MMDLISAENLTVQALRDIFEAAMFDTHLDSDGDLVVTDGYKIIVTPHGGRFIRFLTMFRLDEEATRDSRLELANRINDSLILVRASVNSDRILILDYYLPLMGGGTSRKGLVMSFRAFSGLIADIGQFDLNDIIL